MTAARVHGAELGSMCMCVCTDLAKSRYLSDPSFLSYIDYLQYWRQPQYAVLITSALHTRTRLHSVGAWAAEDICVHTNVQGCMFMCVYACLCAPVIPTAYTFSVCCSSPHSVSSCYRMTISICYLSSNSFTGNRSSTTDTGPGRSKSIATSRNKSLFSDVKKISMSAACQQSGSADHDAADHAAKWWIGSTID